MDILTPLNFLRALDPAGKPCSSDLRVWYAPRGMFKELNTARLKGRVSGAALSPREMAVQSCLMSKTRRKHCPIHASAIRLSRELNRGRSLALNVEVRCCLLLRLRQPRVPHWLLELPSWFSRNWAPSEFLGCQVANIGDSVNFAKECGFPR